LVFRRLEHLVEKNAAGGTLVVDNIALAKAGVDEQAESQGEISVDIEVANGLRMAVNLEDEIVLGEVLNKRTLLVADDHRDIDEAGVDSDGRGAGGWLCCRSVLGGKGNGKGKKQSGDKNPDRTKVFHVSLDEIRRPLFQAGAGPTAHFASMGLFALVSILPEEVEMESAALARRYRIFSAAYLALILIAMIGIGLHATRTMTQWILGDWLINYQGGFVRRGLIGQIIFLLSRWLHVSPLLVAVVVALAAYLAVYWSIWKLLENSSWKLWVLAAFVSPALLGFTVAARGGFHKDVLYLASLAVLLVLLMRKVKGWVLTVYLTLASALCILSHEPLFVYLPYFLAALAIGTEGIKRAVTIALIPMMFAIASFYAVANYHGDTHTVTAVCDSLGKEYAQVCLGSISNLSHSSEYARQETIEDSTRYHYYRIYPPLGLLASLPILMGFADLWRTPGLRRDLKLLAGTAAVSFAMSLTLFYYATDWGRWIYMHLFSLFLILLFLDHRRQTDPATTEPVRGIAGGKARVAFVSLLLFVYATCWNLPNFSDKPLGGYLGLASRAIRTHSLTAIHATDASKTP
jgi:hypothetical protein